jgi:hypothetical protein
MQNCDGLHCNKRNPRLGVWQHARKAPSSPQSIGCASDFRIAPARQPALNAAFLKKFHSKPPIA